MRQPATAAAFAAAAMVGVLMTGACSSDGAPTPRPTASGRGVSSVTTPPPPLTSPASPTIGLPQPSSTATQRLVRRPAGARPLSSAQCIRTVDDLDGIAIAMRIVLDGYPKSPQIATQNFRSAPTVLAKERRTVTRVRGYWRAAGYPATFPTVRDLDTMAVAADRMFAAAKTGDVAPLPQIYLTYNSALQQYLLDANNSLCPE